MADLSHEFVVLSLGFKQFICRGEFGETILICQGRLFELSIVSIPRNLTNDHRGVLTM